jgi:hypothetical protein
MDFGDPVLEPSALDVILNLAITQCAFLGDELPLLKGLGEFGEIAPGEDAMPFGAGFVFAFAVLSAFMGCDVAPTIGLLLCETHNSALAEYALRDVAKSIGVSTYRVTRELPAPVRDELPTVEDLQEVVAKLRSEMEQLRQERQDG